MHMIAQLTAALEKQLDSRASPAQTVPQMVLMRLFSVLDRADFAPSSRVFFPTQTLNALDGLQRALSPDDSIDIATVILSALAFTIPIDGQVGLEVTVADAEGNAAPDGTPVHFSTTLGSVLPASALTQDGRALSTLSAADQPGIAVVTARSGRASGTTTVRIG